jgi:hypothetical protein
MKPIGTKHEDVPRLDLLVVCINVHHQLGAERPAQKMASLGASRFLSRKQPQAHVFARYGVVTS